MLALLSHLPAAQDVHVDLDQYVNRFIPASPLRKCPRPIRWFLGYRDAAVPDVGNALVALWALLGSFAGLALVAAVFRFTPWIQEHRPPVLIASLGAAAILEYNAITSPLAQPRNAFFGHGLSALVGILMAKAFASYDDYDNMRWIAGPLACGLASAVMTLTNTVHPPGGATAVLAVLDPSVHALGWLFLPLLLIACALMLLVALLLGNVQRRYPLYWWTPGATGTFYERKQLHHKAIDVESFDASSTLYTLSGSVQGVDTTGSTVVDTITLASNGLLSIPQHFYLNDHERAVLEKLLTRLQTPRLGSNATEKTWMTPQP